MVIALLVLGCAACATVEKAPATTVEKAPADARLLEARKVFDEGLKLVGAGQFETAVPMLERALTLWEAILGTRHLDVAKRLKLLGLVHYTQGAYTRAQPILQRVLEIEEAALGKHHPQVATSLNTLAELYRDQGDYARAEPLCARALKIQEAMHGKHHPKVAATLNSLAVLYQAQGEYARAELLYERALKIQEAVHGKHHPEVAAPLKNLAGLSRAQEVAATLNNLAGLYQARGDYARAESLYGRALVIVEAALGKHHPHVAVTLNNLAVLYRDQGDYARAESLYVRTLAIREAMLGKHHPEVAATLNNMAVLYLTKGDYARAEPLCARALKIQEAVHGKHHPEVALTLGNLAVLYRAQGDYARAESLGVRALEIQEAVLGKYHPEVATTLHTLALLYQVQGDYARAEPLYERALTIVEAALGKHHPNVARIVNKLAGLYRAQGDYARAKPLHERALTIVEAALGKHHPDVADSLNSLAGLYRAQGDYARAEPLYERALAIVEVALGKHHPHVAASLFGIAANHLAQQHLSEALPLLERAFSSSEVHLRQEVFGFSEARLADALRLLRSEEELLYTLVREYPDNARLRRLVLSAALLRKGRSVEEVSNTSFIIYRGLSQADRETFGRLRALRTRFATLSLAGPGKLAPADFKQRLQELSEQADALEADLARRSEPLRALQSLPPPTEIVDKVQATLPNDSVLIEFVAYRDSPLVRGALSPRPAEPRYLALLLFADGRTSAIDLGPAAPIDRATLRLHEAFAGEEKAYQPAAEQLYALVFRPLEPLLGEVRRLFLSPDGQLAFTPLAALHDGTHFLVDRFDITYLTSGKDLLPRPKDAPLARSVVVLADPDFGSPLTASSLSRESDSAERSASLQRFFSTLRSDLFDQPLRPLPGTRREAEAIQRLLPQTRLLLGRNATKQALLTLETPGLLHIATHGFFLPDEPVSPMSTSVVLEDALHLADARTVKSFGAVGEAGPRQRPPDPLLRSGLVLAGAAAPLEQPGASRRGDSLVTALELAGLDLWGTQLVVLSACDTGRGDVKPGQGVYGLRRALMVAGAETVVTSLWKVDDETTRELMEGYYRNLLAGQGRAVALRAAMKALREKRPHPYYWAPFIAIGQDAPLRGMVAHPQARTAP